MLLWDGLPLLCTPSPKGWGQIILVSWFSFAFSNHSQQGAAIEWAPAWASGAWAADLVSPQRTGWRQLMSLGAPTFLICKMRDSFGPWPLQLPSSSSNFQAYLYWSFFFFFFFGHTHGIWKFLGQGSNSSHRCNRPTTQLWNTGYLTHCTKAGTRLLKLLPHSINSSCI